MTLHMSPSSHRTAQSGQLAHAVCFWLRPDCPAGTAQAMLDFYRTEVAPLDGIVLVIAGTPRTATRDVVDDSYDLAVTTLFASTAAEEAWQSHPVHDRFRERFGPWFARVLVHDTCVTWESRGN